jgi:hypothetical protein
MIALKTKVRNENYSPFYIFTSRAARRVGFKTRNFFNKVSQSVDI